MILLGLYRIAKAMSDSEAFASSSISYRQSSDIVGAAENRNRKTVVRIQSNISLLIHLNNDFNFFIICKNTYLLYIIISVAVIVCFLVCWTPYHIERIVFVIANTRSKWKTFHDLHETLHVISGNHYSWNNSSNSFNFWRHSSISHLYICRMLLLFKFSYQPVSVRFTIKAFS